MGISIGGFNGPKIAEVKSVSAHGVRGCGIYVLYLRLAMLAANLKSEALVSQISCQLEVEDPRLKISHGVIEGKPVIRWTEYTDDYQLGFFFYLSSSQVYSIEGYRNSVDLMLSVWLSGVVDYEGERTDFNDKGDYVISKQQWLEALSAMGYKDTMLFEITMPKEKHTDAESFRKLIEKAQNHFLDGHYQECVGLCRQAIEVVETVRDDKKSASLTVSKYKENRKDMNVDERMLFLREGLKNITQLGAHHGDEFSRNQAQAVLGMTVALLSSPEVGLLK